MKLTFTLNGSKVSLDHVEDGMPLLWILRDLLKSHEVKYGCGKGLCGTCTVWIGGMALRSCLMTASTLQGQEVTTVKGLSDNELHPVQRAWIEEDVAQCGYCQTGQIMAAASLLKQDPNPSDEMIESVMTGNICRCGTYPRIKKAIKRASKLMQNH